MVVVISLTAVACWRAPDACWVEAAWSSVRRALHPPHGAADLLGQRTGNQEAEYSDDDEGAEAAPQAHRLGQAGARMGVGGALVEQPGLLGIDLGQDGADPVHHLLALPAGHHRRRALESALPTVDDQLHPGGPLLEERAKRVEPALLLRVVGCQRFEVRIDLGERAGAPAVRIEEVVGAGDDVAALAGLGVDQVREELGDGASHQLRVGDPDLVLDQLVGAAVREQPDHQQRDPRHREPGPQLPPERPALKHVGSPLFMQPPPPPPAGTTPTELEPLRVLTNPARRARPSRRTSSARRRTPATASWLTPRGSTAQHLGGAHPEPVW